VSAARFAPSGPLRGVLRPPPDKSISHRAAVVAAMGVGETPVEGYLAATDTRSTLTAIRSLGGEVVERDSAAPGGIDLLIRGVGLLGPGARWPGPGPAPIDVGNAGTLLRLLPGWLAGQGRGEWELDGDESIRGRPVDRIAEPLAAMGAGVECRDGRLPPLRVEGSGLRAVDYRMPMASAQVKSCILLAGLLAEGETSVVEPTPTRDHTERMLRACGVAVQTETAGTPVAVGGALPARRVTVRPAERVEPGRLHIPGDLSSAAFPLVAGVLVAGSELRVERVGINPTRVGLLGVLNRMGAAIEVEEGPEAAGEPRGAIVARHGPLTATRVGRGEVPLAIDELPLVALLGCFAEGETVVEGAEELRHKESDRIAGVVSGLRGLGADIDATEDGFVVRGAGGLRGGSLDPAGDHRLALLGAVAGLASRDGVEVLGFGAAEISYPCLERDLRGLVRGDPD
jgi:3-phosphoshikimate 1-carboxyvinyltransferase